MALNLDKKLKARKKPSQERSQKMVRKILEATRSLLIKTDGAQTSKLTTNSIAKSAGISVGSLYQYFPNTEAIIYECYQEMLGSILETIDTFNTQKYLTLTRDEFFDTFFRTVTSVNDDLLVTALLKAIKQYPALVNVDRIHAMKVAEGNANFLKHFGSKWPMEKLQRLGLYIYYLDAGGWSYRDHTKSYDAEMGEWEVRVLKSVIQPCFES